MLSVCAILVLGLRAVTSQYQESPCPGVFEYQRDESGIFGVIRLRSNGPVPSVRVVANFTIATRLPDNYQGRLEPLVNDPDLLQKVNRGALLSYRVDFPVTWPLPRLSGITVNEYGVCYGPGDIPGPNQYITPISLQHTLFLRGQSPGSFNQYQQPQLQQPQPQQPQPQQPQPQQPQPLQRPDTDYTNYNGQGPNNAPTNGNYGSQQNSRNPNYQNPVDNTQPVYQAPAPPPSLEPQYYPQTTPPSTPAPTTQKAVEFTSVPRTTQSPILPQSTASETIECGIVENERRPIIHNGQNSESGEWPWLVAIYRKGKKSLQFICGGTLVSDRHIVTAAQCLLYRNTTTPSEAIVVKIGAHNLQDWIETYSVTRSIKDFIIHESFNASTLADDIAILTLTRSVDFSTHIRPACLWKQGNEDLIRIVGATGVVAGWAVVGNNPATRGAPRVVRIPVVSTGECRASRPDFYSLTSERTLCAGDRNGEGPCEGDIGAGLYLLEGGRWRLRGIVSILLQSVTGYTSYCNLNEFVVFTDTAKYLDWINRELVKL